MVLQKHKCEYLAKYQVLGYLLSAILALTTLVRCVALQLLIFWISVSFI